MKNPIFGSSSVYVHIPFCTKKCPYCHFYVIPNQPRFHDLLWEGLCLEWEQNKSRLSTLESIYFGGGTPSLFSPDRIGQMIQWFNAPEAEITIEANPEESSPEMFAALKQAGINRISLGVQSLDDRSLATLERTHSAKKAKQAIFDCSIENISIDLMYDLPGQTEASWRYTLDQLDDLPIKHVSLYNLTIEPHTSFYKRKPVLPTPEESLRLLHMALEKLDSLGFKRYEISAFAKPGYESRHNMGYWTYRPFLGFGPSAFSYWEEERYQNIANLHRYTRALKEGTSPVSFREKLPYPQNFKERLAIGLRVLAGFTLPDTIPEETTKALIELENQGLIVQSQGRVRLTDRGTLFYDTVASDLI